MSEINTDIINLKCRLCMSTGKGQLEIFGADGKARDLVIKIKECLPITVQEADLLPKSICKQCIDLLEQFYKFRKTCTLSETTLESCLKGQTTFPREPDCCIKEENGVTSVQCQENSQKVQNEVASRENDIDTVSQSTTDKNSPSQSTEGESNLLISAVTSQASISEDGENNKSLDIPLAKQAQSRLGNPGPDDFVLMMEQNFFVDDKKLVSGQMEFYNHVRDGDILLAQRRRREVMPPMWDVYERNGTSDEVTHRRYIVNKSAFPCSLCGKCFSTTQGHRRDYDSSSSEGGEAGESRPVRLYNCHVCMKVFDRRSSLKRHQLTHMEAKPFSCHLCFKGFNRKEHLSRHMTSHSGGRPYSCDLCYKVFSRKEHLTRHRNSHPEVVQMESSLNDTLTSLPECSGVVMRPFVCDVCQQGYSKRELLLRHQKQAHGIDTPPSEGLLESKLKPYTCSLCYKCFTRKEHLMRHHKIHVRDSLLGASHLPPDITMSAVTPQTPDPLLATVKTEGDTAEMSPDMEQADLDLSLIESGWLQGEFSDCNGFMPQVKKNMCPFCTNKFFTRRSHLVRHFKRFHPEESLDLLGYKMRGSYATEKYEDCILSNGQHMCRICNKTFGRRYHLLRHMKLHDGTESGPMDPGAYDPSMMEPGQEEPSLMELGSTEPSSTEPSPACGVSDKQPARREKRKRSRCSYECTTCGLNFSKKKLLKRHNESAHLEWGHRHD